MKVWLTTQIEAATRRDLRKQAKQLGMKIGPLVDNILREALKQNANESETPKEGA